jgi:hypothetical protein
MLYLKQATAVTVKIGPFIDNTDGYTVLGALTVLQANIRLSKNGGNMAQKNDATSATHDELGYYDCPLNTTDTNTLGRLQVISSDAAAMPVPPEYFEVVTANVYDTLFSTDVFNVEVTAAGVDSILDEVIENTLTLRQAIMLIKAVCAGKSSGGGTPTITFRNDLDTLNRVSATVDNLGNRTAVTKDVTP